MNSPASRTDEHDSSHGPTLGGYVAGFGLALVLTLIPFGIIAFGSLPAGTTLLVVAVAGVAQILVHLHFFLHLDMSTEQRWNTLSAVFSAAILFILVGGTVWLFYSLNYRMMVGH